jgi:hypothetical protein
VAVVGGVIVALVDGVVLATRRSRPANGAGVEVSSGSPARSTSRIPRPVRPEYVTRSMGVSVGVVSLGLGVSGLAAHLPLWYIGCLFLAPWVPLIAVEARWKYRHYGFFAIFGLITLLQVGHLGEHTTQVIQLVLTHGDLARSRGVFGRLDFELVHFVWDTMIWATTCFLLWRFGSQNRWLWVAWIAASLHQVEHVYLFWINRTDLSFYANGGLAGILGSGGLIGSPLARPYLHFAYNVCVVIPMVIAFWDQGKLTHDRHLAWALPELSSRDWDVFAGGERRSA